MILKHKKVKSYLYYFLTLANKNNQYIYAKHTIVIMFCDIYFVVTSNCYDCKSVYYRPKQKYLLAKLLLLARPYGNMSPSESRLDKHEIHDKYFCILN